jgi:hypothetical protein
MPHPAKREFIDSMVAPRASTKQRNPSCIALQCGVASLGAYISVLLSG